MINMRIKIKTRMKFLIIFLVFSLSFLMVFMPEAKAAEYSEDYTYNVEVGDVFIFRMSDDSGPLYYEKFVIISKIQGFLDNVSIHASYENYTLASQNKESESNVTLSGEHIRYYEDIKTDGIFDEHEDWYSDTIEIMGSNVECWATSNPESWSPWFDKSTGVIQKRIYDPSEGDGYEYLLVNNEDVDLAEFAEEDASSQGSDGMITYEGTLVLSDEVYDNTQFLYLKDAGIMSGLGTNEDPYIIENINFTSVSTEDNYAINIDHFNSGNLVIKNCLINSGYKKNPICIKQSQEVDIINLTITGGENGIYFEEAWFCIVENCEIISPELSGILLSNGGQSDLYSSDIEIRNNFIHDIQDTGEYPWIGSGIVLQGARDCEIIENNVKNCLGYGYYLENLDFCYDNLIKDNDFSGNEEGCIGKDSGKDNNTYENNSCDGFSISGFSPLLVLIAMGGITTAFFFQRQKKIRKMNN